MKRRDFLKGLAGGLASLAIPSSLMGRILVRDHSFPANPGAEECYGLIVVGIGPHGAEMARLLSRDLPTVSCHELLFDPAGGSDLNALFQAVLRSDLLFLICGFDAPYCPILYRALAEAAGRGGALAVGVLPEVAGSAAREMPVPYLLISHLSLTAQPSALMASHRQQAAWDSFALRHTVRTVCDVIQRYSLICVDFADVKAILTSGKTGRVGVGTASKGDKGGIAARSALQCLKTQGCLLGNAGGVLACVNGSSALTMDEFDSASRVIHESVCHDTNIIVCIVLDEAMGNNVKVTVLAVWE